MKKLFLTALLAVGFLVGASEVEAAEVTVITPVEQEVIEAAQGWVGPLWNATYTAKAEYWAKNVDLSQEEANTIMNNMYEAARAIKNAGIDYDSFSDYDTLIAKLKEVNPEIASQVIALAAEISAVSGVNTNGDLIKVTEKEKTTTDSSGQGNTSGASGQKADASAAKKAPTTLRSGNSSNGNIMKNTGISYASSLIGIIGVVIAGLAAMFVSKKKQA